MTTMNKNNKKSQNNNRITVTTTGSTVFPLCMELPLLLRAQLVLLLLMLLTFQCSHCSGIKPVAAPSAAPPKSGAKGLQSSDLHCLVVVENVEVPKPVGSVWISSDEPCAIYACEEDTQNPGQANVTVSIDDCGEFYCDVDSELRPQAGSCCGACVRTKCRSNDTVYDVGQTWHNKQDCTLLECITLPSGEPMVNAYQKSCPPLPPDCAIADIYVEDCCQYCRTNDFDYALPRAMLNESEDIWTEEFYRNHPCVRDCQVGEAPKTCHYTFVVEWYHTLSKACYECPHNATDCQRPHCIVGDGIPRSVTVVNRMMPGPSIEVCQNDVLVVDVKNHLLGESTTMHWHGLHQRETPYMDGVPHVTQCPISPHSTFRYTFKAENAGTHFWHSHTGMQRGDGVFGALIVRRPRSLEPHSHLYDFDLSEHKMIVQDWVHVPGISMFANHHHSRGDNKPLNLLINGRGRYYKAIWELIKMENALARGRNQQKPEDKVTTTTSRTTTAATLDGQTTEQVIETTERPKDFLDQVDFLHPLEKTETLRFKDTNEITRLARLERAKTRDQEAPKEAEIVSNKTSGPLVSEFEYSTEKWKNERTQELQDSVVRESAVPEQSAHPKLSGETSEESLTLLPRAVKINRSKRATDGYNVSLDEVQLQVYSVRRGFRYRFRIINAEFLNCPVTISIDNHTLTAISSDGYDFEAVDVGSITTYAGERFDFIVNANQPIGSYWVRLKGLMDCSEKFTSAFQVAILRYEGAPTTEPLGALGYQHQAEGIELNVMNRGPGHVDSLTIAELTGLQYYDSVPGLDRDALKPVADYKFFVYYDFYAKDNPVFHTSGLYGFNDTEEPMNRLFTPQLNHISLKFPALAMLPARDEIDDSLFCNETSLAEQGVDCQKEFCKCHHVLQVPLNSVVELIIVDEGFTYDANHPFHLHGNAFRVVGLERLGANVTVEMVKQLDRYNLLKRNLIRPPVKDTVTVPDGGYTIVRFEAYNPGFWLFHCHIEFHAEIGMALVLKVGDNDQMMPVPKQFPTCHDYMPDAHSEVVSPTAATTTTVTVEAERNAAISWQSGIGKIEFIFMLLTVLMRTLYAMT